MYYKGTNRINQRISLAFGLIYATKADTKTLVKYLHVSRPTVIRIVSELRRQGYTINVVRDSTGWHYEVTHYCKLRLPEIDECVKLPGDGDNNLPDSSGQSKSIPASSNSNLTN